MELVITHATNLGTFMSGKADTLKQQALRRDRAFKDQAEGALARISQKSLHKRLSKSNRKSQRSDGKAMNSI